jgi:hypothetical protein
VAERHRDVLKPGGARAVNGRRAALERRSLRAALALSACLALGTAQAAARPGARDVTLFPTAVAGDATLEARADELDAILREGVQDLGLDLDIDALPHETATESRLLAHARSGWAFAPSLARQNGLLVLRIVGVAPRSAVLLTRVQAVIPAELEVKSLVMLRDLVRAGGDQRANVREPPPPPPDMGTVLSPTRSQGRAVLALNTAALGGYIGFSLQRATGSDDPRLLYPLTALGAGLGLGTSMIIADEWDVGIGDAWFLSAGAWWPTFSGLLLAGSYDVEAGDRYVYGLVGAAGGVTLATLALSAERASEGDALMAHSGGFFGLVLGGLADLAIRGDTGASATRGMGYGAGIGVVALGVVATQVEVTASRVLLIDLGASLGALTGAAAASPLLLVEEDASSLAQRIWLTSTALGTVVGAAVGWWLTEPARPGEASSPSARARFLPFAAPAGTHGEPGLVVGVHGAF